eukprot:187028-Pyramimonas_sp.AAC.1
MPDVVGAGRGPYLVGRLAHFASHPPCGWTAALRIWLCALARRSQAQRPLPEDVLSESAGAGSVIAPACATPLVSSCPVY